MLRRRSIVLVMSVLAAALMIGSTALPSAGVMTAPWSAYLFGPRHASYNQAATAFTPTTATAVTPAWTFTAAGPTVAGQPGAGFAASPTVSGGVVYIGANTGVFSAVDEATGAELWHRSLGYTTAKTCGYGRGITSTATVAPDPSRGGQLTVYVAGGDGYLYALKASDGTTVWRKKVVGIGTTQNTGYNWSSPTVSGGTVVIGMSSQCDKPLIRGGIKSFSQSTGTLLHTYFTVPSGSVGGSVWTSVASDNTNAWATVGNGDSGDSFQIVRLDAGTLAKQEGWTVPGTAGTDLDWGSSPTLFNAVLNGTTVPMVGGCNKNGVYYALRSTDLAAGPVWSRRLGVNGDLAAGKGSCLAAGIWDFTNKHLYVGSNTTTIHSVSTPGSVRALDPATGHVLWAQPLSGGPVMGSPALSGGGVIAAGTYNTATPTANRVYLLNASTGQIVNTITESSAVFSQPVFADDMLFIAAGNGVLTAYRATGS
jgi:outer membrane protein assembly factor BamB